MQIELLKKYANIKAGIKALQAEEDEVKADILQGMEKEKTEKVDSAYGSFTVAHKRTWIYTEKVKDLEEKVKLAKVKEEEQGKAKAKVTDYLLFKPLA